MANDKVPSKSNVVTEESLIKLLPGFRFHPTDEEIIVHYLMPKVMNNDFTALAIGQVDFNKCEPWDLPNIETTGDVEERYYYCLRDRKYPTGSRTNRATKAGYWKATGKDREISMENADPKVIVGMKKTLVFYKGRAPRGEKTNWVMHEFRLHHQYDQMPKEDYGWVVSKVFHKNSDSNNGMPKRTYITNNSSFSLIQCSNDSFSTDHILIKDNEFDSLPTLIDHPSSALSPPYASNQFEEDLKPANMWHLNSSGTYNAYDEDQLFYAGDPSYYSPRLPETLIPTAPCIGLFDNAGIIGSVGMLNSNNNNISNTYTEGSSNIDLQEVQLNEFLPSANGSIQDYTHMWDQYY